MSNLFFQTGNGDNVQISQENLELANRFLDSSVINSKSSTIRLNRDHQLDLKMKNQKSPVRLKTLPIRSTSSATSSSNVTKSISELPSPLKHRFDVPLLLCDKKSDNPTIR